MNRRIRTAIIGPGKVAHTHARILAALPQSQFVAVCGRNAERTAAFAEEYGVQAFTDLNAMVHDAAVQMLIVCTPHPQHAEQAIVVAAAGVHVLVEKPMAITAADCDRRRARQSGGASARFVSMADGTNCGNIGLCRQSQPPDD
jgi:predicted dehydrogenase